MSSVFKVEDYIFEGQHIREYPDALADSQEDVLKLEAKRYTPLEVHSSKVNGDFTIIAYHANAIPKECYEPFFEILYTRLRSLGKTISSIWIADQAFQNTSALLNDDHLGNDFHWWDHSRDVLLMVSKFRQHMKRPLVALGHSMGAAQAVMTSHFHPRLFEAIILVDPAMNMTAAPTISAMMKFAFRKPRSFGSRQEAEEFVSKIPFFKTWQPASLKKYLEFAFHDSKTALDPSRTVKPRTTVHAEVMALSRPNPGNVKAGSIQDEVTRYMYPDIPPEGPLSAPVYNPQTRDAYIHLRTLRPTTLYLLGADSKVTPEDEIEHRTFITGTGVGGNGGTEAGNVTSITLDGGHFLPMVNPEQTATVAGDWISKWLKSYQSREDILDKQKKSRPRQQRQALQPEAEEVMKSWDGKPWDNGTALKDGGRSKL